MSLLIPKELRKVVDQEQRNVDPEPADRVYYRHVMDGDRGYLVVREGVQCIKLDRPNQVIFQRFSEHDWAPDTTTVEIPVAAMIRVAFEADRELRRALGDYAGAKLTWENMDRAQKLRWEEQGPGKKAHLKRRLLFAAVKAALQ